MKEILTIKNLKKSYTHTEVLHGISLSVSEGEVVAIIGKSGGGKSTLLKCATFLEKATSGSIKYLDTLVCDDINGKSVYIPDNKINEIKQLYGLVFQNYNLFPHYTVLKNLIDAPIHVQKRDKDEVISNAEKILKDMDLYDKKDEYPMTLSGGQKQRVAIGRALMTNPKILFFDEPTSALDPELTKGVLNTIKNLAKMKKTMVIVTHEMNFARDVADRVIFIDGGVIVEEGSAKDIIDNPKNDRTKRFIKGEI